MNGYLEDIISQLGEPIWWDDSGTIPRYCEFMPTKLTDIYANECVLLLIECQSCHHLFRVAQANSNIFEQDRISRSIRQHFTLGIGDPPNIRCCPSGPTMSSNTIRVLECWIRNRKTLEWTRIPELEIVYEE